MATRQERIKLLAEAIAADIKSIKNNSGDLTSLSTVAKTSLVAAINEIFGLANTAQTSVDTLIDDTATNGNTTKAWSADKIYDELTAAIDSLRTELKAGAGEALDTFKELANALGDDPNFATTIATAMAKRVRVDAAQTFTVAEKLQGCENLGLGDPDHNFVTDYIAIRDAV